MPLGIILSGIIAPSFFWACYFYYKDRFQPEPIRNLGMAYILGFVAASICFKCYGLLPVIGLPEDPSALVESHRIQFLGYSLGITGLLEESFKFIPFIVFIIRFKAFNEKTDGIIYSSTIALGFASFENIGYLKYLDGLELFGRAFASPLTHAIFSSIWGYTSGKARIEHLSVFKASSKGLILATFFHGIFNFFTTSSALRVISSVLILFIWIWQIKILEQPK